MKTYLRPAFTLFVLLTLLTGVAYPLLVTAIGQTLFAYRANGSILKRDGKAVGSELLGQAFDAPGYFWSRPSATGPVPYTAFNREALSGSSGANLGPTNSDLLKGVKERIEAIRQAHSEQTSPVPLDLVTASASGLDPHISPAAAEYQVGRVAKARSLSEEVVRKLVSEHTESRTFGVLGEPRVNVLRLNLALDASKARQP